MEVRKKTKSRLLEWEDEDMGALCQFNKKESPAKAQAEEAWTLSDLGREVYGVVVSNIPFIISIPYKGNDLEVIPGTHTQVKLFKTHNAAVEYSGERMKFLITLSTLYAASPPPLHECNWMDGGEIQMQCVENAHKTFSR